MATAQASAPQGCTMPAAASCAWPCMACRDSGASRRTVRMPSPSTQSRATPRLVADALIRPCQVLRRASVSLYGELSLGTFIDVVRF
jgi:hypothetical protein